MGGGSVRSLILHRKSQPSLLQNDKKRAIDDLNQNTDLYSVLSFRHENFLIEFSTPPDECAMMRALTFDSEMNYETIRKLEKSIESQTGVHPTTMVEPRRTVTATDIVQLIL